MFKKILTIFLFVLLLIIPTGKVLAATSLDGQTPNSTNYKAPQQADFIGLNLAHAGTCWIAGTDPTHEGSPCDAVTPGGIKLYYKLPDGGALGTVQSAMIAMYKTPPVSTDLYLARAYSSLGFSPVYAASGIGGSGDQVLEFVLNLWTVSRNISYLLFILIFAVVGFMIMFRHKINPQTVVTVQMALPRLAIGLVLVTFSYLIAALIVDLAFVGAGIVGLFFNTAFPTTFASSTIPGVQQGTNAIGIFTSFFIRTGAVGQTIWGFGKLFWGLWPGNLVPGGGAWNTITSIPSIITSIAGGAIGIIVVLIVLIAALIQCLRLVWGLLQCYISILVFTVLGPFIILISSIPGQEKLLGFWWRNILGNVLAFPAVFGAFLFATAILDNSGTSGGSAAALPLFGGIDDSLLRAMIAIGIVLGTPAIPKMTRDLVGAKGLGTIAASATSGASSAATVAGIAAIPVGTGLANRFFSPKPGSPRGT